MTTNSQRIAFAAIGLVLVFFMDACAKRPVALAPATRAVPAPGPPPTQAEAPPAPAPVPAPSPVTLAPPPPPPARCRRTHAGGRAPPVAEGVPRARRLQDHLL